MNDIIKPFVQAAGSGAEIPIGELARLNKALQDNAKKRLAKASVGYPAQGQASTGDFAPLVPQSIQNTLDTSTYLDEALVFWRRLTKISVLSPLHESVVRNKYGNAHLDPFIAEGGLGARSAGEYERKTVRVKYLAEYREISDVATLVGMIGESGVTKAGLANETNDGTMALLGKLEQRLFLSDSANSPLAFDGIYQQIRAGAPGNYTDKEGASITPQELTAQLYEVFASPNFGTVTSILVDPRVYAALAEIALSYGRFSMPQGGSSTSPTGINLRFGIGGGLELFGPVGAVPIIGCPLMRPEDDPNTVAYGDNAPAFTVANYDSIAAAPDATAKFRAGDAGDYIYKIVAVGDKGISAPVSTGTVTVAAGQKVTITLDDDAFAAEGNGSIRYYRVYRSDKNGGASTCKFMWEYPRAAVGVDTTIVDQNLHRPNTSQVYLLRDTPDTMQWIQLLDFLRRPLANTATSVPFLLMIFGTPFCKLPKKNWIFDNVALSI